MSQPLLLIGGESEIGSATMAMLRGQGGEVVGTTRRPDRVSPDRPMLDLSEPVTDWVPPAGTRAVCICAAIARLGECAADPQRTALINVTRTIELADNLLARGIPVLFLSTDKVFSGAQAHVPGDAPLCPVSEYGRQKAAAESLLGERMASGAPVSVLRLSKVVPPTMPLLRQWAADLRTGRPIRVFFDMMMAPTPVATVAVAIAKLLSSPATGIFQLTGPRDISYRDAAMRLAGKLGVAPGLLNLESANSGTLSLGFAPENTTLDSTALRDRFGITVPDAWDVIDPIIETCC